MKGSMTIEAVFVMAVILLIILWIMQASLDLYQQAVETAKIDWIEAEEAAETFRRYFFIKELLE